MSGATVLGYLLAEGLADSSNAPQVVIAERVDAE
jgi:hypothetical protein